MLKRLLVLVCGLVLFVTAFFIHQYWFDATTVEGGFRAEREKFHVEGVNLVSSVPPGPEPLTPTPPPLPVVSSPTTPEASGVSTAVPTPAPAPAANAVPLDSNTLIVPTPSPSSGPTATPDANTPNTASPATNSSPDSTLLLPNVRRLPLLLVSGYTHSPRAQTTDAAPSAPAAPAPAVSADTNGTPALNAPAPTPAETTPAESSALSVNTVSHAPGGSSVIILGYHQFTPPGVRAPPKMMWTMPADVFETEMKYLKDNHFNVVPLSDVVAFAKGEITLPPNTVAITIDDGYKSPLVFAAPVLKRYGFPWTFFVYPSFIGNHPTSSYRGAASWPELVELQKEGVDIECHSMTHPLLTKRGGKTPEQYEAWLDSETVQPKQILEKQLGKTIKYFAYPYGGYNKEVEAKTIAAGYEAIFTVADNPIHPGSPLFSMGRYIITTPVERLFTSYLRQIALGLVDISPAPGATITDPRPAITARLGYQGKIDPASIIVNVRDMGDVREDFDPATSTIRIYLPRDLIDSVVNISVHAKDAATGQTMSSSWRFNYQPVAPGAAHAPIGAKATAANSTNAAAEAVPVAKTARTGTNEAASTEESAAPVTNATAKAEPASASNAAPAAASNAAPAAQ